MNRSALVATLAGVAAVAAGALLRWVTVDYTDDLRGPVSVSATGRELVPALLPLAGAALAALGAVLATKGLVRRGIALLLGLMGVAVIVLAVFGLIDGPGQLLPGDVSAAAADIHRSLPGVLLTVLGGVLWCFAGLVYALASHSAALGGRYERRPARPADDEIYLWRELDAHRDPTVDPPADAEPDGPVGR